MQDDDIKVPFNSPAQKSKASVDPNLVNPLNVPQAAMNALAQQQVPVAAGGQGGQAQGLGGNPNPQVLAPAPAASKNPVANILNKVDAMRNQPAPQQLAVPQGGPPEMMIQNRAA